MKQKVIDPVSPIETNCPYSDSEVEAGSPNTVLFLARGHHSNNSSSQCTIVECTNGFDRTRNHMTPSYDESILFVSLDK